MSKVTDILASLPNEYHHNSILRDNLVNEVLDVQDCLLAYKKPADSVPGVIYDLHALLATNKLNPAVERIALISIDINFVDGLYVKRPQTNKVNN